MTVLILVEATLKAGCMDEAMAFLAERFPETRTYPGCQDIHAYTEQNASRVVFVEHWDTRGNFERYLDWRQQSGSFTQFSDWVDGELNIRSFEQARV